jgi:hypothetical protein
MLQQGAMPMLAVAHSYDFLIFYEIEVFFKIYLRADLFKEHQMDNEAIIHTLATVLTCPM